MKNGILWCLYNPMIIGTTIIHCLFCIFVRVLFYHLILYWLPLIAWKVQLKKWLFWQTQSFLKLEFLQMKLCIESPKLYFSIHRYILNFTALFFSAGKFNYNTLEWTKLPKWLGIDPSGAKVCGFCLETKTKTTGKRNVISQSWPDLLRGWLGAS